MSTPSSMLDGVIDAHTHLVPRVLPRAAADFSRPWVRCLDETRAQLVADGHVVRNLDYQCWDIAARLAVMDEECVAMQVVSPMPELLTPWLSARETQDVARHVNDAIATLSSRRPDRFLGLGMVSLQDPDAAVRQLESIRAMGLSGVEAPADVAGRCLSDARFATFFAEVARHGLTVFVHPIRPPDIGLAALPAGDVLVGYPVQTGRAVVDLASAQVTRSCPRLKLLFAHGGGVAATLLNRCSHGWQVVPAIKSALPTDPMEVARGFYYDTLVYDAVAIRYLADTFGADRLLVGSDFPFILRERYPGRVLAETGLSDDSRRLVQRDNALGLFSSPAGPAPPSRPNP
jgi:aminocarboxymuconate-semialdehyde decarboxylase